MNILFLLYHNRYERNFFMAKYKVDITGVNTNNINTLSKDEMLELFKKYQEKKDLKAKDILINGNLKLVLSILKKYNNRCDNMDDLFQVGVIGLIKAIDNFDLSYNLKLSTYAKDYQGILGKTGFARTQTVLVYHCRCYRRSNLFRHFHNIVTLDRPHRHSNCLHQSHSNNNQKINRTRRR